MSIETLTPYRKILQLQPDDIKRRLEDPNDFLPKHLLMSALSEKLALNKGAQQPVDSETVRDRLVAQATPQPAGVAGMMPQQPMQQFSDGSPGGVRASGNMSVEDFNRRIIDAISGISEFDPFSGLKGYRRRVTEQRYPSAIPELATAPTAPTGEYRLEGHAYGPKPAQPPTLTPGKKVGISEVGPNPTAKYKDYPAYNVLARNLEDIKVPEVLTNAALPEAIKDVMAQRAEAQKRAERNALFAGMTSFGEGMVAPGKRGFAAAFAPAANASMGIMQNIRGEADKEDARLRAEQRGYGIAQGAEKVAADKEMYARKTTERAFEVDRADKVWKAGMDTADAHNKNINAQELLKVQWAEVRAKIEAVRESAAQRRDATLLATIQRMDAQAQAAAEKAKQTVYDKYKNDHRMITGDQNFRFLVDAEAAQEAAKALESAQKTIEPILRQAGIPSLVSATPTASSTKRAFPGS